MRIFNELSFTRRDIDMDSGHLKETVTLRAYVPGVNSGSYSKKLHITAHQTKPFRFHRWLTWKFGSKETMNLEISLNETEMRKLRDEINQILRLPFTKEQ